MTLHNYTFSSIEDLLAVERLAHKLEYNVRSSEAGCDLDGWVCADRSTRRRKDCYARVREPMFATGVERIEAMAAGVSAPAPKSRRRKSFQSDQGDELDLQRVWQGDLDRAWRSTRREMSIGPSRVLVVINACAHAGMSPTQLALRGTAALALSTALQSAGYAVGVIAALHTRYHDSQRTPYQAEIVLQDPGSEADLHKLASLVASGLMLRGVIFDHMYKVAELHVAPGLCPGITGIDLAKLNTVGYDYVAVVSPEDTRTQESSRKWVESHIEQIQGKQDE